MGCMNHYCITNKILNFFVDAFLWCFCNRRFCFCGRSGYHTCVEMRSFRKEMSKTWVSDEDKNNFCNYQHDIYDIYLYIHMTVNKTKITTMMVTARGRVFVRTSHWVVDVQQSKTSNGHGELTIHRRKCPCYMVSTMSTMFLPCYTIIW